MSYDPDAAQIFYLEASRLRDLAEKPDFADVRAEVYRIAEEYEALGREHMGSSANTLRP